MDKILTPEVFMHLAWQTTAVLAVGLLLNKAWQRRPARAHFCLLLALVGCLLLPWAALGVRHMEVGLMPQLGSPALMADVAVPPATSNPAESPTISEAGPWRLAAGVWAGCFWLAVSAFLLCRFALSFGLGLRIVARAQPLIDEVLYRILEETTARLGVRRPAVLFTTHKVTCPAIWCWTLHPIVLLPSGAIPTPAAEVDRWSSIFAHELAHARRRDHLGAVLAEMCCIIFWWQPLAWVSRARLLEASDAACDAWVLAGGHCPASYAETLLSITPQVRAVTALSMASSLRHLKRRVAVILNNTPALPTSGPAWQAIHAAAALTLVAVLAFMQPPAAVLAAANMLSNPGMEQGTDRPESWLQGASVEGVEYKWDRTTAHTGKSSLCLKKTAERYFPIAEWNQEVSLRQSDKPTQVQLSCWVKADGASKATVDIEFQGADGSWQHKWAVYIGPQEKAEPPATHDWKQYTGKVELPAGTSKVAVGFQIYGPGTVWFDDAELLLAEPASK